MTEEYMKSDAKFKELGSLAVTVQDHKNVGSTPTKDFLEKLKERSPNNPDSTLGELMTQEEILSWISENEEGIKKLSSVEQNDFVRSTLAILKTELELGKKYLKSIGKL